MPKEVKEGIKTASHQIENTNKGIKIILKGPNGKSGIEKFNN